jgi:hypothetical protein
MKVITVVFNGVVLIVVVVVVVEEVDLVVVVFVVRIVVSKLGGEKTIEEKKLNILNKLNKKN